MACEVTIKLKHGNKSLTKKTLVFKSIEADWCDSEIESLLAKSRKDFGEDSEQAKVVITLKLMEV